MKLVKQKFTKYRLALILLLVMLILSSTKTSGLARPISQESGPTYVVQQGDTLNAIAIRFGVTAEEIIAANAMDNPNALFVGQNILIPGLEGISGLLTSQVVPLGTSLSDLTRQNQLQKTDLMRLNRLTSPSEMIAGVSIIVPINETAIQPIRIPSLPDGVSTLEAAILYGMSPWALIEQNQRNSSWELLPGETIYAFFAPESPQGEPTDSLVISVNRLPLVQGETMHISISSPTPLELSGRFDDVSLRFFSEAAGEYHSFHGIHALAEPGIYSLQITAKNEDNSIVIFDQLVLLTPGFYPTQMVYVGTEFLDDEVIEEEDAYFFPQLERFTPTRHWQGLFQYPVDEPCVNSPFGLRRIYNDGLLFFYHTGMDFSVCRASNLNIYAPAAGEVILVEDLIIRGGSVLIDHGWGVISGYWHLSEFNVNVGDFVQPGDLIGIMGNTGRSAGTHLHFEMIVNGTPVNPQTWLDQTFP